ncbi:conserved hypothetical protein [Xanthomonas citri pv. mangiferaeindicae LMG 941]|nr:conserved hypothetical protein [Xanthomonas citri pv. mangiferaeindicae LMG 941]
MAARGQLSRQAVHVCDEGRQIDRLPRAPGQRTVGRTNSHRMGNSGSRQAGHGNRRSQKRASLAATCAAGKSGVFLCDTRS